MPRIRLGTPLKRYGGSAEIDSFHIFIKNNFWRVLIMKFLRSGNFLDKGGYIHMCLVKACAKKINLKRVDQRFVALDIDADAEFGELFCYLLAAVSATWMITSGHHYISAEALYVIEYSLIIRSNNDFVQA